MLPKVLCTTPGGGPDREDGILAAVFGLLHAQVEAWAGLIEACQIMADETALWQ
jgi:hypothetical protein